MMGCLEEDARTWAGSSLRLRCVNPGVGLTRGAGRGETSCTHQHVRRKNAETEKLEAKGKLLLPEGTVGQGTHLGKC